MLLRLAYLTVTNTLAMLRLLPVSDRAKHRNIITAHHGRISRPKRVGRQPTVRSIRALVLRLAKENNSWGYRRIHGELLVLGVKLAPSTVWEILNNAGIDPAPDQTSANWAAFLRSHAKAILAR